MSDFFAEVDDAMKQERLEKFWHKYGLLVIGFLALIVLSTAANSGYKLWSISVNGKQTALFLNVVEEADYTSQDLLDITAELRPDLSDIVKLNAAGLALEDGDKDKALEIYNELQNSKATQPEIRQLSALNIINLSQDISPDDKAIQLNAMANDKENPWRYQAHLGVALLAANNFDNFTTARKHLTVILEAENAPNTLRQKAQSLDILYSLEADILANNTAK